MATTFERVRKIIVDQLGVEEDQVVPSASFVDELDADCLDLAVPVALFCNDAEAAALGESALRPDPPDLIFIGLDHGIGRAHVRHGRPTATQAHPTAHRATLTRHE